MDENDNVNVRLNELEKYYDTNLVKPEVEWRADGTVLLTIFLPLDERTAEFAAIKCGEKWVWKMLPLFINNAYIHQKEPSAKLKGKVNFDINIDELVIPENHMFYLKQK